ncbi:MAG: signal peptidase II [Planctomycetota bacterium]|nr:signal peptidase II [Planctomycetota bacterium]
MTKPNARDKTITPRAWRHAPAVARFLIVAVILLAADLVTKPLAFEHVAGEPVTMLRDPDGQLAPLPRHEAVILIPRVLALHLTANEGAVFGLGRGGRWIFIVFSIIACGVIAAVFARSDRRSWLLHLTLAAILAGALGNLYDRLVHGVVRDMLLLFPGVKLPFGWRWPDGSEGLYPWIFNIADVCLVVGLVILMIIMYRADRRAHAGARGTERHTGEGTPSR